MSGTLIIQPVQAKLTHDTDTFSKMDPYCLVTCGDRKAQGKVCSGGGKTPHWEDSITIEVHHEKVVHLELKDKDVTNDDIIGVRN